MYTNVPFPEVQEILNELKEYKAANNGKLFKWNSYSKLEKWIRDVVSIKELGIKTKGSFHSIRKMRENQLISDSNLSLDTVAQLMGHTRRVQEDHYIQELKAQELAERINIERKNTY